jgi:hypothetical protein
MSGNVRHVRLLKKPAWYLHFASLLKMSGMSGCTCRAKNKPDKTMFGLLSGMSGLLPVAEPRLIGPEPDEMQLLQS